MIDGEVCWIAYDSDLSWGVGGVSVDARWEVVELWKVALLNAGIIWGVISEFKMGALKVTCYCSEKSISMIYIFGYVRVDKFGLG